MWRRWSICCKVCCTDICKSFPHGKLWTSRGSTSCHLEKRCHFQMCYSTVVTLGLSFVPKNRKPQQSMFSNANVHSSQSFQIQCNAESLELLHVPSLEEELWSTHSLLLSSLCSLNQEGLVWSCSKEVTWHWLVRILAVEEAKGVRGTAWKGALACSVLCVHPWFGNLPQH